MHIIRKSLFIGLFIASWSISQLALVDHVYSTDHLNDTVCEWCVNQQHTDDDTIVGPDSFSITASPLESRFVSDFKQVYISNSFSFYYTRGPPAISA